jgi:undecaprenyl pyrophosphate phosphatase UppP
MNNINNFTNAHQDLIAWVVVILLVFLIKICRNILDNFQLQKLVLILLVGYTVAIICKLLIFRSERFEEPNLDFLWSYRAIFSGKEGMLSQVSLNILLFNLQYILLYVPPDSRSGGCFLATTAFLGKRKLRVILPFIVGITLTTVIESLQFFLHRGMFELDDIFNNTVGTVLGILIALLILGKHTNRKKE